MPDYRLSKAAENDLLQIREYTLEKWGKEQVKLYLTELATEFKQLSLAPAMGRLRAEIDDSVRSFQVRQHIIFYRQTKTGIEIARVLHETMDLERHFKPKP